MNKETFHKFITDPTTGPLLDRLLADNAALDELLSETALEAAKRRFDETFQRGIRTFYANTEPRKEK